MAEETQVVDADTASEEEVSRALGLGTATSTEDDDAGDEDGGQESQAEFTELPKHWQDEITKLRRENAASRVKIREAKKTTATKADNDAIEQAKDAVRSEVRLEYGMKLAAADVRAALAGIIPDDRVDDVLDDLNLAKYVDDEGEVDGDAVKALKEKYQALVGGTRRVPRVNTAATTSTKAKSAKQEFADLMNSI